MNKSEFVTLLQHPQNLGKPHLTALKKITEDFPYFQSGHILLTRTLLNENHYEFEKSLKTTALLATNRELLFSYLHDTPTLEIHVEENEVVVIPPIIQMEPPKLVEEEILTIPETWNVEETKEEVIELVDEQINDTQLALDTISDQPILIGENLSPSPSITSHQSEHHSMQEWLSILQNELVRSTVPEIVEKEIPQIDEQEKPKSNIPVFESILDKFIRENPSISRPKADFYKPASMAKLSVEEDDDLVTETLANLYYKQGSYKKAIRAYEKLCLIYPHKMSYFADLIQKIKESNKE